MSDRFAGSLASRSWIWLSAYVLVFLPLTLYLSSRFPLWYDEIHTVYISRFPTIGGIWSALAAGADLHPPASYLATRIAQSLFGPGEWALRLPATLGVLAMGLCIMIFIGRRANMLWGFAGAMFVLLTGVYPHAFEARPYGMFLGLAALSLVCWQSVTDARLRKTALVVLPVVLALAISCHYYAVLLFFPIAIGEAVRDWVDRRIDWPVWCSLLVAAPSVFLFLPLLRNSLPAVVNEKTTQVRFSALWTAFKLLDSAQVALAVVAMLVLALIWNYVDGGDQRLGLPVHEAAAALAFLALPVPAMFIALTVTHNLTERYVLPLVLGAAVLFVVAVYRLTRGSPTAAFMLAVALAGIFGGHTLSRARSESLQGAGAVMTDPRFPNLPIVISAGLAFVPAWHYAPPELRSRLVFIADAKRALQYRNNDQSNLSVPYGARFFHWPVQTFEQFRAANRRFLLNWHDEDSWLLYAYRDAGARIEVLQASGDNYLLLISDPGQ